jgi:hypothetical protein
MNSTFAWLLVAFPAYLMLRGRFIGYLALAAGTTTAEIRSPEHGATGSY